MSNPGPRPGDGSLFASRPKGELTPRTTSQYHSSASKIGKHALPLGVAVLMRMYFGAGDYEPVKLEGHLLGTNR